MGGNLVIKAKWNKEATFEAVYWNFWCCKQPNLNNVRIKKITLGTLIPCCIVKKIRMYVHPAPTPPSVYILLTRNPPPPPPRPSDTRGTCCCCQCCITSACTGILYPGKDKCPNKFDIKTAESDVRDVGDGWMDSLTERASERRMVTALTRSDGADTNSVLSQAVVCVFGLTQQLH
jgi:hypothetical protein